MSTKSDRKNMRAVLFDTALENGQGIGAYTPFKSGDTIFLRCQNYYYVGRVKAILQDWVVLEEVSWIPDTGRFSEALALGTLHEVEPYPGDCAIRMETIDDVSPWPHDLPRAKK